jgi:hypothetical protein
MKPIDALKRAIEYLIVSSRRFENRPGAVIEKMAPETREALKGLKSSDIDGGPQAERIDVYGDDAHYRNKEFEKDKISFDKKFLKIK